MLRVSQIRSLPEFFWLSDTYEMEAVVEHYLRVYDQLCRRQTTDDYDMVVGYDTETTGLDTQSDVACVFTLYSPHKPRIKSLGLNGDKEVSFVIPGPAVGDFDSYRIFEPVLDHPRICKVGANVVGYDSAITRNSGGKLGGPLHDTLVMSWAYNENRRQHGLKAGMFDFYDFRMTDFKDAGGNKSYDVRDWPFHAMLNYTGLDGFASYKHWEFLHNALRRQKIPVDGMTMWDIYLNLLQPAQYILRRMMDHGVKIDMPYLDSLGPEIKSQLDELHGWFQKEWHRLQVQNPALRYESSTQANKRKRAEKKGVAFEPYIEPINLNSTAQIRYLFFDLVGEKVLKMGKPGKVSGKRSPVLDKTVLEELSEGEFKSSAYAEKLLTFRELDKLYGTYIGDKLDGDEEDAFGRAPKKGGLRNKIHFKTGRVHTNFKFGPVTGRLSSSGPNLMNIPTRTETGKKIRKAFIPEEGYKLIVVDYSQLEMRLFAHFSEYGVPESEQIMCASIRDGLDVHCMTASLMMGVPYEDVLIAKLKSDGDLAKLEKYGIFDCELTELEQEFLKLRSAGKTIGFGILYGMGPHRLSIQLEISYEKAQEYINLFFKAYPFAKKWVDFVHKQCESTGYVWTILNRPRRLQEIFSKENWVRARAKRQSVNSIIQGSAADVVISAMLRCDSNARLKELGCRLLLQVHDELVFEIPEAYAEEAKDIIVSEMVYDRKQYDLGVDLTVSAHVVDNWGDAK